MNIDTKQKIRSILMQISDLGMELSDIIDAENSTLDSGYSNGLDKLIGALAELSLTNEGHLVNGVVVKK